MFRILVVEDIEDVLREMKKGIEAAFSKPDGGTNAKVHTAGSVDEAIRLIEETQAKGKSYHAAILDFKLPPKKGEQPQGDFSICQTMKNVMPEALVVHITAYPDEEIVSHLKELHVGRGSSAAELISKVPRDWPAKLIGVLKAFLYGALIDEQIQDLFGGRGRPLKSRTRTSAATAVSARGERSLTHAIATLSRDIETYWRDLDDELKAEINEIFRVDIYGDFVRVSLIRETKGEA